MTPAADRRTAWLRCEFAWIDGGVRDDVLLGITDGRITAVRNGSGSRSGTSPEPHPGAPPDAGPPARASAGVVDVHGVTLPGLVNAHSHAFHRVLRGRAQDTRGSFWSWRRQMYATAAVLDPDRLHRLARAVYAEMAVAGITCVGEFHYLHHPPGGGRYADANAMGAALVAAAQEAGVRLTLLDTLYLTAGVGATVAEPALDPVQRRFSDGTVASWVERTVALRDAATVRIGAAVHSVRAVPPPELARVVAAVGQTDRPDRQRVLHAHVAEQRDEVTQARDRHGRTPVELLADAGAVGPSFTAVHGVWLDQHDMALLADGGATVCACPTTERDLADGIVAVDQLRAAGVALALGTDQHVQIDLFEEARAAELDRRLVTRTRGLVPPAALLEAATRGGARSLGWHDAGRIALGAPADLCVVGLSSARLAGTRREDLPAALVHVASAADVRATMVAGRWVARDGRHQRLDVAAELRTAIGAIDRAAEEAAV